MIEWYVHRVYCRVDRVTTAYQIGVKLLAVNDYQPW